MISREKIIFFRKTTVLAVQPHNSSVRQKRKIHFAHWKKITSGYQGLTKNLGQTMERKCPVEIIILASTAILCLVCPGMYKEQYISQLKPTHALI